MTYVRKIAVCYSCMSVSLFSYIRSKSNKKKMYTCVVLPPPPPWEDDAEAAAEALLVACCCLPTLPRAASVPTLKKTRVTRGRSEAKKVLRPTQ